VGYNLNHRVRHGYFTIPCFLFDNDLWAKLPKSACKLFTYLYFATHRCSSPCIRITGSEIEKALGMDSKTYQTAREVLQKFRLVRCTRGNKAGTPYEIHLINPETGEPFPTDAGRPPVAEYKPRARQADADAPKSATRRAVRGPKAAPGHAVDSRSSLINA